MTKIALFGLGSMGFGIGKSLLAAELEVHGFDVNQQAVENLAALGALHGDAENSLPDCEIAVLVVVNAAQVTEVLFGEINLANRLPVGSVVISCPTVPPEFARETEQKLNVAGIHYLDAPISGGSVKAAEGALTIMASGTAAAFDAAQVALDATAQTVFRLGDCAGPGSAMKVVNQLLAGVHIAATAEAMTFGISQGVDPKQCVEVISQCAGSSWMFENRGPHIAEGDYTPHSAIDIFVKDLGIVSDIARQSNFSSPLTATALQQFVAAAGMGLGREDDAAVAKVYARNAGISLPGESTDNKIGKP